MAKPMKLKFLNISHRAWDVAATKIRKHPVWTCVQVHVPVWNAHTETKLAIEQAVLESSIRKNNLHIGL